MGRREQREQIFKLLFRVEFNTIEEMPEQCRLFFEDEENTASAGDEEYIREKLNRILEKLPQIDELISTTAKGWTIDRIPRVSLTVLRLALSEILYGEEKLPSVTINEAVELTKKFGGNEDYQFVNGLLGSVVRELGLADQDSASE